MITSYQELGDIIELTSPKATEIIDNILVHAENIAYKKRIREHISKYESICAISGDPIKKNEKRIRRSNIMMVSLNGQYKFLTYDIVINVQTNNRYFKDRKETTHITTGGFDMSCCRWCNKQLGDKKPVLTHDIKVIHKCVYDRTQQKDITRKIRTVVEVVFCSNFCLERWAKFKRHITIPKKTIRERPNKKYTEEQTKSRYNEKTNDEEGNG